MRIAGQSVRFTTHALDRYKERVRDVPDILEEVVRIAKLAGHLHSEAPAWISPNKNRTEHATQWLMIGDDIAFPIINGYCTTCVVQGSVSPQMRKRRNDHRARTTARRRNQRGKLQRGRRQVQEAWAA